MLSLEPIEYPEEYNYFEKKCFDYLLDNNINKNDIFFLKEIYDKEGIKFCIHTFNTFDLNSLKRELEIKNNNILKNILFQKKELITKFLK